MLLGHRKVTPGYISGFERSAFNIATLPAIIIVAYAIMFPFTLLRSYVFSTLWGWIVVPFFGLPAMPIAVAFGVLVISSLFRVDRPKEGGNIIESVANHAIGSLFILLSGWLVSLFI